MSLKHQKWQIIHSFDLFDLLRLIPSEASKKAYSFKHSSKKQTYKHTNIHRNTHSFEDNI